MTISSHGVSRRGSHAADAEPLFKRRHNSRLSRWGTRLFAQVKEVSTAAKRHRCAATMRRPADLEPATEKVPAMPKSFCAGTKRQHEADLVAGADFVLGLTDDITNENHKRATGNPNPKRPGPGPPTTLQGWRWPSSSPPKSGKIGMLLRFCLFVCNLVFDIPLHATRRAMAAALSLPKGNGGLSNYNLFLPERVCAVIVRHPILLPPMSAKQRKRHATSVGPRRQSKVIQGASVARHLINRPPGGQILGRDSTGPIGSETRP